MIFHNFAELQTYCEQHGITLAQAFIGQETANSGITTAELYEHMEEQLNIMEASVERGRAGVISHSGMSGLDAMKMAQSGKPKLAGAAFFTALTNAIAVNEVNAAMGVICAAPTAGSSGIVPGILTAFAPVLGLERQSQLDYLITAAGIGMIIGNNATLSGAAGGCQAEIGSAAAMAAGALVEAAHGIPRQSLQAVAMAMKNMLGLSCDPVAGLVEIPCIKRNAGGTAIALAAAEMALAGVESRIPCDEVIEAMWKIGQSMPDTLKETARGGLAMTETGRRLNDQLRQTVRIAGRRQTE